MPWSLVRPKSVGPIAVVFLNRRLSAYAAPGPCRLFGTRRKSYNFGIGEPGEERDASRKLKQFAESVEPGVVVVEPWVLRRIIRLDGRVQGFRQLLSRRQTYPIERNRLLALVDSRELGMTSPGSMPERLVVLAEPEELDLADAGSTESLVNRLARPLFHACVHLELEKHFAHEQAAELVVAERRKQLGESVFAEIHAVLLEDDRLFPGSSDVDVYVEFVASYLEMSYFVPRR